MLYIDNITFVVLISKYLKHAIVCKYVISQDNST